MTFRFFRLRSAINVHSIEYSRIRSWSRVFVRPPRGNRGMPIALLEPTQTISRGLDIAHEMLHALDDEGITQALRNIEALSHKTYSVMLELVAEHITATLGCDEPKTRGYGPDRRSGR